MTTVLVSIGMAIALYAIWQGSGLVLMCCMLGGFVDSSKMVLLGFVLMFGGGAGLLAGAVYFIPEKTPRLTDDQVAERMRHCNDLGLVLKLTGRDSRCMPPQIINVRQP